jgi:transcriptional regulator with XRE-family HTH domain
MEKSEKSEKHYRRLCKLVTRARKAKKLTQKDLAERLGHTQSYIAKLERGLRPVITLLQYLQMAEIIGFDPARLVRRATKE